jgi:hypothetical protein
MPNPQPGRVAKREDFKVLDPPCLRTDLDLVATYTLDEFERIKRGLIPLNMEDRWFVFFEEPWLYFHRSWTGRGIYGVEFRSFAQHVSIVASWVGRERDQEVDRDYYRDLLKFLIDDLMLGKPAIHLDPPQGMPKVPARYGRWGRLRKLFSVRHRKSDRA